MSKRSLVLVLLTSLILFSAQSTFARLNVPIERAVVKVFAVGSDPNYSQPWQAGPQEQWTGSGAVIASGRVITNAHVVANQTFIEVQRQGDPTKYPAKILVVGHECDLALIEVDDPKFMSGVEPIAFGEMPKVRDKVAVYGFPMGGDMLSITEGVVSRIEIGPYSHSWKNLPQIQIDAAINPGNSGGPVIMNDKIVGIAFQGFEQAQNIGYMIPPQVIEHFLIDAKDRRYDGFPTLGIKWEKLENTYQRTSLGMKQNQTGILVTGVAYNSSSWGVLERNDVILSFDNHEIADDGTVAFVGDERILFSYYLVFKYPGDHAKMRILREGKEKEIDLVLQNEKPLIPVCEFDVMPSYYIWEGLVFVPLSLNYLQTWDKWRYESPVDLRYHFMMDLATPDRTQVVILDIVLADEVNAGYHDINNEVVTKVNGEKIKDLKDLIVKIEAASGKFVSIETESGKVMVLGRESAAEATPRVMKRYRIPFDRSEDLR